MIFLQVVNTVEEFQAAWQTEMYNALNFAQFPANRPLWRLFLQCTYVRTYSTKIQKLAMTIMTLLYALYAKNVANYYIVWDSPGWVMVC